MPSRSYNEGIARMVRGYAGGSIDVLTATIKVMLVGVTYVFDPDHTAITSITADELTGGLYARGTTASKTLTKDAANDRVVFTAANQVFTTLGPTVPAVLGAAVVFMDPSTGDANCVPLAYLDGADVTPNGGDVTVTWPVTGIFYFQI